MKRFRFYILFLGILVYSLGGVITKSTNASELFSLFTFSRYLAVLFLLIIYAVLWQISLKTIDLSIAFMAKGSGIVFGLFWARFIFGESISFTNILGALVIIAGIILFAYHGKVNT